MTELTARIVELLRPPQLAVLATISDDGKPWARYVFVAGSEDMTIRFATYAGSRKVGQIRVNPDVHLTCGARDPAEMRPYLQIQGRAECSTHHEERHGFWKDSLKNYFKGPDDPNYAVVSIRPYRIELCTPGSIEPEIWQR